MDFNLKDNIDFWHTLIVNIENNKTIKCYVSDVSYESALREKKLLSVYGYDKSKGYETSVLYWRYAIPVSIEPILLEEY